MDLPDCTLRVHGQGKNQVGPAALVGYLADKWILGALAQDWWSVPVGVAAAKVQKFGKLPIKLSLGLQWFPVQPEEHGQDWNVRVQIVPVVPKLIKGNLAEPSSLRFGMK